MRLATPVLVAVMTVVTEIPTRANAKYEGEGPRDAVAPPLKV
jgi:hypothetical protein